jgi:hypothetical protein
MTSLSHVAAKPAVVAATPSKTGPVTSEAAVAISLPKPKAAASAGPAATVQLSDAARAKMQGDKDWTPGTKVDNH